MPTIHYVLSHAFLKNRGIGTPQNLLPPHVFSFSSLFANENEDEEGNEDSRGASPLALGGDESNTESFTPLASTSTPTHSLGEQVEVVRKKKVVSDLEFADSGTGASKQKLPTTSANSSTIVASLSKTLVLPQQQPNKKKLKRDDPELKVAKEKHDKILADLHQSAYAVSAAE